MQMPELAMHLLNVLKRVVLLTRQLPNLLMLVLIDQL